MKLPCAVTRDLLPLYAEELVEQETQALIEEHLTGCSACRGKTFRTQNRNKRAHRKRQNRFNR